MTSRKNYASAVCTAFAAAEWNHAKRFLCFYGRSYVFLTIFPFHPTLSYFCEFVAIGREYFAQFCCFILANDATVGGSCETSHRVHLSSQHIDEMQFCATSMPCQH